MSVAYPYGQSLIICHRSESQGPPPSPKDGRHDDEGRIIGALTRVAYSMEEELVLFRSYLMKLVYNWSKQSARVVE